VGVTGIEEEEEKEEEEPSYSWRMDHSSNETVHCRCETNNYI
jgi:hypothetical protein